MTLYRFVVSGTTRFPFKLLAIDKAWPASEENAEAMDYAAPTQHREVTLALASYQRPTAVLWREAGWPLQRVES